MLKSPYSVLVFTVILMWCAARLGAYLRGKWEMADPIRDDFGVILAATLTLLGLIIGFSFSMAISRYDQRKHYEEEEANAIGTEYLRADLLPGNAELIRNLLRSYLDQRILFYETRDAARLGRVENATSQLEQGMWSAVRAPAIAQPTPVAALAVSGMNDVLNSGGYTAAAWLNRIPFPAWGLMIVIAFCCNLMIGYGARRASSESLLLLVLPIVVAISFFLIADIDAPRRGLIRVHPQNLISLQDSLRGR